MPRVESSIVINAPRETVLSVARDNEKFPEYMADVKSLAILEKSDDGLRMVTDWVGIVPKFGAKVHWVEEDIWDLAEGTCTFKQVSGDYDQFEASGVSPLRMPSPPASTPFWITHWRSHWSGGHQSYYPQNHAE
jgi:uncharacterized membrane protein